MLRYYTPILSASALLLLSGCFVPGNTEPNRSTWTTMDYAALTCDPDKPPASCPPLHPNGTAVVPNNNTDTHHTDSFFSADTHSSQSDVQHSADANNTGFSGAENNNGAYGGYYSENNNISPTSESDVAQSAAQNNLGFSAAENNHGDYGYVGGHK